MQFELPWKWKQYTYIRGLFTQATDVLRKQSWPVIGTDLSYLVEVGLFYRSTFNISFSIVLYFPNIFFTVKNQWKINNRSFYTFYQSYTNIISCATALYFFKRYFLMLSISLFHCRKIKYREHRLSKAFQTSLNILNRWIWFFHIFQMCKRY